MKTIADFLLAISAVANQDISDNGFIAFYPGLYRNNRDVNEDSPQAKEFFNLITGYSNILKMDKQNVDLINGVYEASSQAHKTQLIALFEKTLPMCLDLAKTESVYKDEFTALCLPVIQYTATLVKNGDISFEQFLNINITAVKTAFDPKSELDNLYDLKASLPKMGLFGIIRTCLSKIIGLALQALGVVKGTEMVTHADATLKIHKSLNALSLFVREAKPLAEQSALAHDSEAELQNDYNELDVDF